METLEKTLSEHPFFENFPKCHLAAIAGCARNVRFEAGHIVFEEGEEATNFYLIREGKVALQTICENRGPLSVLTVGDGEILGWSWLFPPHRYKYAARTLEPTRAFAIDGPCLRAKAELDHKLGCDLLTAWAPVVEHAMEATRLQLINIYQDL